jgi:biotin carboxyl carrier protein
MDYSVTSEFLEREFAGIVRGSVVRLSDNVSFEFERDENNKAVFYLNHGEVRRPVIISADEDTKVAMSINGYTYKAEALNTRDKHIKRLLNVTERASSGSTKVVAPMPGLLKSVNVQAGQTVKKGERLFILEAMKMENDIKSPMDGVVTTLNAVAGAVVEKNFLLCFIETATPEQTPN